MTQQPAEATAAAARAAQRSGVQIRELTALADVHEVYALFDRIWQPDPANPPVTVEQLRALTHAGNYLAGAYDDGILVAACVGFFAAPPGRVLHSHVTGVAAAVRGRHVGFALKAHQRAWALERGLSEITWTFDPLVRRNAHFNLATLQARPAGYLVDFYGDMDDAINGGQGSDRLLTRWPLDAPEVAAACAAGGGRALPDPAEAPAALTESPSGRPAVAQRTGHRRVLVATPPDIEALRGTDPDAARRWRRAVREVLGGLLAAGARVAGFTASGSYVVERTDT